MTRLRTAPVLLVTAALVVAGCGGSSAKDNGIAKLSPTQVLAKVKSATQQVSSVHATGSISQNGKSIDLDVHVGTNAGTGTLKIGGGTVDLRLVKGTTYFRADSKAFAAFGANSAQASLAAGKWIKAAGTASLASDFSSFLSKSQLFSQLLQPSGSLTKGSATSINGTKALPLVDHSSSGGTLYVAETGQPLPVRVSKNGGGGHIDFTDYNASVSASAPSGAIDISQLGG